MRSLCLYMTPLLAGIIIVLASGGPGASQSVGSEPLLWSVEKEHSTISFTVRHVFTPVTGTFEDYDVDLVFHPDHLERSYIRARLHVLSINTDNASRDNDLRSDKFFNVAQYPYIEFTSNRIEQIDHTIYVAIGTLKIRDCEKPFELPFTLIGLGQNPKNVGYVIASFQAELKIKRSDFGIGTGRWADTAAVGDVVGIHIAMEAHATEN